MPSPRSLLLSPSRAGGAAGQVVLSVAFLSPGGGSFTAIGGGATFADAVEFARQSLPAGHDWRLADWNDVYGE